MCLKRSAAELRGSIGCISDCPNLSNPTNVCRSRLFAACTGVAEDACPDGDDEEDTCFWYGFIGSYDSVEYE